MCDHTFSLWLFYSQRVFDTSEVRGSFVFSKDSFLASFQVYTETFRRQQKVTTTENLHVLLMLRELLLTGFRNSEIRKIIFRSSENQLFYAMEVLLRPLEAAVDRYNAPLDQLQHTGTSDDPITNFSTFRDWCPIFRDFGTCASGQPYRIPDFVLSSYEHTYLWT